MHLFGVSLERKVKKRDGRDTKRLIIRCHRDGITAVVAALCATNRVVAYNIVDDCRDLVAELEIA